MLAWLAPLVVFGLVVFVHELGHFIAAKMVGVYAPRFSVGFGPALLRRRFGETEYVLAALPLGGYVRMASREDEATAFLEGGSESSVLATTAPSDGTTPAAPQRPEGWDPEALVPFGPHPVPEHRWFESKSLLARLLILIAGVTMNVVLALVVSTGAYAGYGRPYLPAVVDSVLPNMPAQRAGLLKGDSIVAIAGRPVRTWMEVLDRVGAAAGTPITLDYVRAGERRSLTVMPEPLAVTDPASGRSRRLGRIGAAPRDVIGRDPLTFPQAVAEGWTTTWHNAGAVIGVVRGLFTRDVAMSNLGGPIAIGRASVDAARSGLEALLYLIAFLSINIAVLNLLPIPILDGGQILMNVLESAKGRPFSARTREYILRAGLGAIALLFVVVMWNDIKRLFG